ncbi:TonB-dependent receptor [Flavobacterium sp.]|uniref:TonB-dependent receptor n=1 Tax=Flavobacterium sp. TaxID=239 RepID=UPI0025BC0CB1|nr:TonB-dependent receptor [Flavobacterium sp.]
MVAHISVFAQTDSISSLRLEPVTISRFHVSDSLLDAPAAIGVVSSADLKRNNNVDISPAINRISGVLMQSGSLNTNRISIRGIGARTPFGTNKIRAFYGNIPLTSGDSETTIEDIDVEIINKVEIIKGPLSSVYGSGLGGAILIDPKVSGPNGNSGRISSTVGSFGLLKNTATYSLDSKNGSLNIGYHRLESDGWRQNSKYKREGVTLAGELFRRQNSKLTYFGNYTYLKAFIPSSIDKATFDDNPQNAAATWLASKGFEQYDSWIGGLSYDWKVYNSISNATSVFVNHKKSDEPRPFDILRQNTTGYGARTQFTGNIFKGVSFLAGMEFFRDGFKGKNLENLYQDNNGNGSLAGAQLSGSEQDRTIVNAFAQLRATLSKKFEVQAGLNFNKTSFGLDTTFPAEAISSEDYSYDGIWSPQLSFLYKPSELQTIYVSASRGFSMPAIEETLTPNGTINPNIKPENGYNLEIGGKFFLLDRKLFAEISVYRMSIKDLLVAQRVGDDQYVGVNAGETLHQGIEVSGQYAIAISKSVSLRPFANISFGEYKFEEFLNNDIDYSGNKLTGVPSTTANAGLSLNAGGLYLLTDFRYVDEIPLNDANSLYNDSYRVWNAKAGYKFVLFTDAFMELFGGVNNIGDEKYASMILPNATAPNGNPRYYYPGMPVNYFGGLSFNCNF